MTRAGREVGVRIELIGLQESKFISLGSLSLRGSANLANLKVSSRPRWHLLKTYNRKNLYKNRIPLFKPLKRNKLRYFPKNLEKIAPVSTFQTSAIFSSKKLSKWTRMIFNFLAKVFHLKTYLLNLIIRPPPKIIK